MKYILWFWVFTTYPQGEWHKYPEPSLEKCYTDMAKYTVSDAQIQECTEPDKLPQWKANK